MKSFTKFQLLLLTQALLGRCVVVPSIASFGLPLEKEKLESGLEWTITGSPAASAPLELQIALKYQNTQKLLDNLADVSDPNSKNYREWATLDEVNAIIAPAPATVSTVKNWLLAHGVPETAVYQPEGPGWLLVNTTVSKAEELLQTKYALYSHPKLQSAIPRVQSYSLPASVHGLIDTVQPTTARVLPVGSQKRNGNAEVQLFKDSRLTKRSGTYCNGGYVDTSCLSSFYGLAWNPSNRAQVATVDILNNPASQSDQQTYNSLFTQNNNVPTYVQITLGSGTYSTGTSGEGNLDTQYVGGMAGNIQSYYIRATTGSSDGFSNLANYLSGNNNPPTTISISYGFNEPSSGSSSVNYVQRICYDFAVAAYRGITIFVASGDEGVSGFNDPSQNCPGNQFVPTFPSTCPYVTSVGGTYFTNSGTFQASRQNSGEAVAQFDINGSPGGSGGGYSNIFTTPSWQQNAVNNYYNKVGGGYKGNYNQSGRAYPDVAAIGENMVIVENGKTVYNYQGTSFSAPIWAGLTALLNDYLISQGKHQVGFLTPSLYGSLSGLLTDITSGNSRGCNGVGFLAITGWDPATGLGTPNWGALAQKLSA